MNLPGQTGQQSSPMWIGFSHSGLSQSLSWHKTIPAWNINESMLIGFHSELDLLTTELLALNHFYNSITLKIELLSSY